jgi:hypothetical protein
MAFFFHLTWDLYWTKIRKQPAPPLTVANVQALEDFWRYHIETGMREKFEMIWLIGFRGEVQRQPIGIIKLGTLW